MPAVSLIPPREWPTLGWQVIEWCERYLCHGPGDIQERPFFFDLEWAQVILDLYRLYPPDHERAGRRVVAYGVVSMPKGRAKSEVAGALVCAELLGPVRFKAWDEADRGGALGQPVKYPFIRCLATEEGQTGNTYRNVMVMLNYAMEHHPREFPEVDVGATRVFLGKGGTNGEVRPCTSGSASKDGGKETFAVADETHLYDLPELHSMHNLVRQNCGKRRIAQPWMLATTTMFEPGANSVAEEQYTEANRLATARNRPLGFSFHHRQGDITPDEWMDDERQLESLTEAYGEAASWMDLTGILENDIRAPGKRVADAARYWHNLEWKGENKAIDLARWDELAAPERMPTGGEQIVLAFDGSDRGEHADDTVLVGLTVDDRPHIFLIDAWRRPPRAGREYKVPRHEVRQRVAEIAELYQVRRFVCDPPGWREEIDRWEAELGDWRNDPNEPIVIELVTASPATMGPAIDRFLEAVDRGTFTHDGTPALREYVGNALLGQAKGMSRHPALSKPSVDRKIDGLIAAVIGHDALAALPEARTISFVGGWFS